MIATRVLDTVTREPLPDAVLALGARTVTTGSDGRAWYSADHYCTFTEMRR